jgi:hypothetical protein
MSEIESQTNDMLQFNKKLDDALEDAENGLTLTLNQIDDLRYACGLPAKQRKSVAGQYLWDMMVDMNKVMAESLKGQK